MTEFNDARRTRTVDAKIERLRQRIIALSYQSDEVNRRVLDILKGILDLLEDEL